MDLDPKDWSDAEIEAWDRSDFGLNLHSETKQSERIKYSADARIQPRGRELQGKYIKIMCKQQWGIYMPERHRATKSRKA